MIDFCKKSVAYLYSIFIALVLVDVLIIQQFINQLCKKNFALPNIVLLIIGAIFIGAMSYLVIRYYKSFGPRLNALISRPVIGIVSIVLFFVQLYILKNIYFLTGWDAEVIFSSAKELLNGNDVAEWYYSAYPNNLFLTYVFAFILKINSTLGIYPENGGIFAIIAVQCALAFLTAYLVYSVCVNITESRIAGLAAYVLYVAFIGFSPWLVIPYSDSMGLVFPLLTVRLYQLARASSNRIRELILYGVIGLIAFIGFKIKPQIAIIFIAIVLWDMVRLVHTLIKDRKKLVERVVSLAVCFAVFISTAVGVSALLKSSSDKLDPEAEIGVAHFAMMGLNDEYDGIYNSGDVDFSQSYETRTERSEANIRVVKERLSELGFFGTIRHIAEKSLVNFGDGTFAWVAEGSFFKVVLPMPNDSMSGFLRSFYYTEGNAYDFYITFMQFIWIGVLALSLVAGFYALRNKGESGITVCVLMTGLIGLILFETIFEARARYLFTYAPIFVICATVGLFSVLKFIKGKKWKG